MTRTILVSESIEHIQNVIKESARVSERLIEIKERQMKRNAKAEVEFLTMKGTPERAKKLLAMED